MSLVSLELDSHCTFTDSHGEAIKKKHSKTAEESRYQGTVLGKDSELQPVAIAGGSVDNLSQWSARRSRAAAAEKATSESSAMSSALSTPIDTATPEQG